MDYGAIAAAYRILKRNKEARDSHKGTKEPKGPVKGTDWKTSSNSNQNKPGSGPLTKKQLPTKIRQIPGCCILPRRSIPSVIAFYGAWIIILPGAAMLAGSWINKKVKEDSTW